MTITPGKAGTRWPGGIYQVIALIFVDNDWVSSAFGQSLRSGDEPGLGPWVGAGGVLPSGEMVEAVKYALADGTPCFELRIDTNSSPDAALNEFVRETAIAGSAVIRPAIG